MRTEAPAVLTKPYWRADDAAEALAAWRASGVSLREFCRRHHLDPRRLKRWLNSLEAPRPHQMTPPRGPEPVPPFHEITVRPASPRWLAELHRGPWALRVPPGFDAPELARLLALLETSC